MLRIYSSILPIISGFSSLNQYCFQISLSTVLDEIKVQCPRQLQQASKSNLASVWVDRDMIFNNPCSVKIPLYCALVLAFRKLLRQNTQALDDFWTASAQKNRTLLNNIIWLQLNYKHIYKQTMKLRIYKNLLFFYSVSKTKGDHPYVDDTNQYRSIAPLRRFNELKSIINQVKSEGKLFTGSFPEYPLQYEWSHKNKKYNVYFWEQPKSKPKAILINFHALNAHTGLSGHLAADLAKDNILVGGYDYFNFGKSEGEERGNISSVQEIIETSQQFLLYTKIKYPSIPIYLSGLSLGGLVAFYVSLQRKKLIEGTIFLNPAFEDNPYNNKFGKDMIRAFGQFIPPIRLTQPFKSNSSNYSLEQYKKTDPHMYVGRVWSSTVVNLLKEMGKSKSKFEEFDLPFLYVQGGSDKLVNPFNAFELEQKARSKQKQVVIIHDLWHALWFDDKHFEVISIIKNWINGRQK